MKDEDILKIDVDEEGETSGYVVSTLVHPILSMEQREGEAFVRITFDPGGAFNGEVRIPVEKCKEIAPKLKG